MMKMKTTERWSELTTRTTIRMQNERRSSYAYQVFHRSGEQTHYQQHQLYWSGCKRCSKVYRKKKENCIFSDLLNRNVFVKLFCEKSKFHRISVKFRKIYWEYFCSYSQKKNYWWYTLSEMEAVFNNSSIFIFLHTFLF